MVLNQFGKLFIVMLATATSPVALAQGSAAPQPVPGGAAEASAEADGIHDIIVTASRFSQTIQRSSSAISVIGADRLVGVTDVRQLQAIDPGVQLGIAGGVAQTFIRGVGSFNLQNTQEGSVSYNVDGVFLFAGTMISPLMYDLERVEVLKGPQGTLYGRNASGGVVNLITSGASLGKFNGYVEGEVGNYDLRRLTGAINIPVTENLAVRVAAQHAEHEGYLSDGTDDQDVTSARLRVLWEPSSAVTLRLGADYSRSRAKGFGASPNPNPTDDKFIGGLDPRLEGTYAALLMLPPVNEPFFHDKQWSVNAQLDTDLGFATLTVLPAYRHEKLAYRTFTPFYQNQESPRFNQHSLEVRLADQNDMLKWVVGGYYFKITQKNAFQQRGELLPLNGEVPDYRQRIESYAFFGEATYNLTDTLRVIGGLRYTHESTRSSASFNDKGFFPPFLFNTDAFNPYDPVTNPTGEIGDYYFRGRSSAEAITWKVGAEYDVAPESMLFATASRGFKGGGTYIDRAELNTTFKPEHVTAFELGSRNRFFNNKLQFNVELFYWKLKDQQIPYTAFNTGNPPQVALITANAGSAEMYGADVSVVWQATPDDMLRFNVERLHSKYTSFKREIPAIALISSPENPTACDVSPVDPVTNTLILDCSGQPVIRSPKWAIAAGYQHRFDLQSSGELLADVDMTYASRRAISPEYIPLTSQRGQAIYNASLTYNPGNKAFSVQAWIRNIGNARVMAGGGASKPTFATVTLQPPRTYGASMRFSF